MTELKEIYLRKGFVAQDYVDISQEFFVEINTYFKVTDCNLRYCRFMNKSRKEIFGSNIVDAVDDKDRIRFQNNIRNTFVKKFREGAFVLDLKDYKGRKTTASLRIHPVFDESNNMSGLFLRFVPFAVRNEDSRVNTLFMSIYDSLTELYTIYATDTKARINSVNSSLREILGYSSDEMKGRHIADFLVKNKEQEENIKNLFKSLAATGKFTGEVFYLAKDEEEIPIHLSISNLVHNGSVIGSLGIGRDMREQKKLESENKSFALQVQNQSRLAEFGMMLQGVAHNMSTPLTGIKSSAQLQHSRLIKFKEMLITKYGVETEIVDSINDVMKFFELIDQSVSKLASIIRNLMSKARDQQSLTREPLNLGLVMEQELEFLLSNQFFKNKIEKEVIIQKDIPLIYGLYSDFSQSFVNVMKNAIDAMWDSEMRKMLISVSYSGGSIEIKIADTGKGIPDKIRSKIFEPFFTTKPKFKDARGDEPTGTGIGLDSVRTLLKPYGAEISIESEVGEGTTFIITVPTAQNQKNLN